METPTSPRFEPVQPGQYCYLLVTGAAPVLPAGLKHGDIVQVFSVGDGTQAWVSNPDRKLVRVPAAALCSVMPAR